MGRGDRSAEYARQRERRAAQRRVQNADNGWTLEAHPILESARTAALRHVRPDRRSAFFRPTFEDAVSEAVVAIVAGGDPALSVRRFVSADRAWLLVTAPLLEHARIGGRHDAAA